MHEDGTSPPGIVSQLIRAKIRELQGTIKELRTELAPVKKQKSASEESVSKDRWSRGSVRVIPRTSTTVTKALQLYFACW
jgi:hypothetical protein